MLIFYEELICFAAICESGSITAASRELGCSKAHVSRKLTDLEGRLGAKLMHRTTRRITFTRAGEGLRGQALQQYLALKGLARQAEAADEGLSGRFVITASLSLCTYLLAPEMPDLQAAFPEIRFDLRPSNESLDLVSEGIDLAIRTGSVVDDSLIAHPLGNAREIFLTMEDDGPERAKEPSDIGDLDSRPLYINPYSLTDGKLRVGNGRQVVEFDPAQASLISDFSLLVDLARRNRGIALAPDYSLAMLGPNARRCLGGWQGREWPVLMAYPFIAPPPVKLSAVAAYLRPRLSARLGES